MNGNKLHVTDVIKTYRIKLTWFFSSLRCCFFFSFVEFIAKTHMIWLCFYAYETKLIFKSIMLTKRVKSIKAHWQWNEIQLNMEIAMYKDKLHLNAELDFKNALRCASPPRCVWTHCIKIFITMHMQVD